MTPTRRRLVRVAVVVADEAPARHGEKDMPPTMVEALENAGQRQGGATPK